MEKGERHNEPAITGWFHGWTSVEIVGQKIAGIGGLGDFIDGASLEMGAAFASQVGFMPYPS
jgi:hypothetical protein